MEPGHNPVMLDGDHCQLSTSKRDWNSLPVEIKQKTIKYLPLNSRFSVMSVSKPWQEMIKQVNSQETKLLIIPQGDIKLLDDSNSLCGLASHTFDRSSVLEVSKELTGDEARQLAKNFPNLRALSISILLDSAEPVNAFGLTCRKLEHFSSSNTIFDNEYLSDFQLSTITCLDSYAVSQELVKFPNLIYYSCGIPSSDVFAKLLSNGLVGFSIIRFNKFSCEEFRSRSLPLFVKHLDSIEVLYDFNPRDAEPKFVALLPRMKNLTTLHVEKGTIVQVRKSLAIKSLLNFYWIADKDVEWHESNLIAVFERFGHRLRKLRIRIPLHPEKAVKAILATCPNLEELNFQQQDKQQCPGNSLLMIQMLQKFTKLKRCGIDGHELNMKLLRMVDTTSPELNEHCEGGGLMTIKQLLEYQHLLSKSKSCGCGPRF